MPIQVPGRQKPQRIDVVINDVDNNVRYWVDVTKIHEMTKTNQETAPAGTSPAVYACNTVPAYQPKQEYTMPRPSLKTQR